MENNTCNNEKHWLHYWHDTQSKKKINIQETKQEKITRKNYPT